MARIGITLGDVNGIGPEVVLKALGDRRCDRRAGYVLIGAAESLRPQARALGLPMPPLLDDPHARTGAKVCLWEPAGVPAPSWRPGRVRADAARAAHAWLLAGIDACRAGCLDALVTAPISKEGFHRARLPSQGHTEILAARTGTRRFAMMLVGGGLRVVLATRHVPLAAVPRAITPALLAETFALTATALPWLGMRRGRIGVCGLNPHAGDGGALGREELSVIAPAVRAARRRGLPIEGPLPGDTVFHEALRGRYAAVVAMYHDQGLAPLKAVAFESGVNVTLGLPIVRTSPDHGTAYGMAGQGRADPSSMIAAIHLAVRLARRPNPWARGAP